MLSRLAVLALVLVCSQTLNGGVEQEVIIFFRGDVNGSGSINISDPTMLSNYLYGGGPQPPTCSGVWDANNDGSANGSDVAFLLDYLFGGGSSPSGQVSCYQ